MWKSRWSHLPKRRRRFIFRAERGLHFSCSVPHKNSFDAQFFFLLLFRRRLWIQDFGQNLTPKNRKLGLMLKTDETELSRPARVSVATMLKTRMVNIAKVGNSERLAWCVLCTRNMFQVHPRHSFAHAFCPPHDGVSVRGYESAPPLQWSKHIKPIFRGPGQVCHLYRKETRTETQNTAWYVLNTQVAPA